MSPDRDANRIVRSWLHDDRHEDASRVLGAVMDHVDATPQRSASSLARRFPNMNNLIRVGLVAAAVVVIAVIAINLLPGSPPPGGDPSPSPSSIQSPEPSASAAAATTLVVADPRLAPVEVTLPIPPGWIGNGHLLEREVEGLNAKVGVWSVANVYGDPCQWEGTLPDPPVGPTVGDLTIALGNQPMRNAATEVATIDSYDGTVVHMSVPADIDFADCDAGQFTTWTDDGTDFSQRFQQAPGQLTDIYIIDVEGTRVVIDVGHYPETPETDMADIQTILDGITFQP